MGHGTAAVKFKELEGIKTDRWLPVGLVFDIKHSSDEFWWVTWEVPDDGRWISDSLNKRTQELHYAVFWNTAITGCSQAADITVETRLVKVTWDQTKMSDGGAASISHLLPVQNFSGQTEISKRSFLANVSAWLTGQNMRIIQHKTVGTEEETRIYLPLRSPVLNWQEQNVTLLQSLGMPVLPLCIWSISTGLRSPVIHQCGIHNTELWLSFGRNRHDNHRLNCTVSEEPWVWQQSIPSAWRTFRWIFSATV